MSYFCCGEELCGIVGVLCYIGVVVDISGCIESIVCVVFWYWCEVGFRGSICVD